MRRYLPKNLEELISWYERRVAPFALFVGFIADNILFRVIDFWAMTFVLTLYLACALIFMFMLNLVEAGRVRQTFILHVTPFFSVIVQWAFGGMFSGFLVLYSESATMAASWVSVAILAVLLVANERFRRRYLHFSFQLGVLFTAILGLFIFLVPLALNQIGPVMFLASGVASVAFVALYLGMIWRVMPELVRKDLTRVATSIGTILLVANILYFTNAIPPLPLALKEAGIYHRIERVDNEYHALAEPAERWRDYLPFGRVFHRAPGEAMYVFSSVFAPAGLGTTIYHEWQHRDLETGRWRTTARVPFPIIGGRDGGYRGDSLSANPSAGKWRVNVLTGNGLVIGRVSFSVVDIPEPVELEGRTL